MSARTFVVGGLLALATQAALLGGCSGASGGGGATKATQSAGLTCAPGEPGFARVKPLLSRYCISCHSDDGDAGEEHDFTRPELLRAQHRLIVARLRAHSMPPRSAPQPDADELATIAHWADCGASQD